MGRGKEGKAAKVCSGILKKKGKPSRLAMSGTTSRCSNYVTSRPLYGKIIANFIFKDCLIDTRVPYRVKTDFTFLDRGSCPVKKKLVLAFRTIHVTYGDF